MQFSAMWMNLETVILNGINQTEKDKYFMISLRGESKTNGTTELICKTEIESQV